MEGFALLDEDEAEPHPWVQSPSFLASPVRGRAAFLGARALATLPTARPMRDVSPVAEASGRRSRSGANMPGSDHPVNSHAAHEVDGGRPPSTA